jgi:glycosyltransferase involved in cell wall biosynthesis
MDKKLSVIIPAHNEEKIINRVIDEIKNELSRLKIDFEIIVINDASTDKTKEIIEKISGIRVVHHPFNRGYGASLKTGIREAQFDNLLFFDADGQHKTEYLPEMIKHLDDFDLISGARQGYKGPIIRQPGKRLLLWLANYLSKEEIPDLNCGLRIVKKDKISRFLHLLCNEFSFSTTTLLMFATEGLSIKYVPITINKRTGTSRVRPKHAIDTFIFILRAVLFSEPLRVFLPMSGILFLITLISAAYDIFFRPLNITDITIVCFIASVLIFFFGLMADQLATIRRDIKK